MNITENQIDTITHSIAQQLLALGLKIDSDQACDLNDLLTEFIIDKCGVEVTDNVTSTNPIRIQFDIASATAIQEVRLIDPSYNEEMIIEGLNNGSLITTTWFNENERKTIDVVESSKSIAEIISQEIDGQYDEFC